MRFISAQYVLTGTGTLLKRPVICAGNDGTILNVENTGGDLPEKGNIEFYNGIIIPGFVNCHCHLELSYLHNEINPSGGLHGFLLELSEKRNNIIKDEEELAKRADKTMSEEGVVVCADICNSPVTFKFKTESSIRYINLIEVFGIDHNKAQQRIDEALFVAEEADRYGLPWFITPHSVYSVPLPLFRLVKNYSSHNKLSSVHFLESAGELSFLENHSGPLMETYRHFIPPELTPLTAKDHITAVFEEITSSGHLILVHNTFIEKKHIDALKKRDNLHYCLCPNSNLRIEGKLPPVTLLAEENCSIVIGTDSLSSNDELSMLSELKTLNINFPQISLIKLIQWATYNGAVALSESNRAGTIEPGKKPGLVLIKNLDLSNLRLLPESRAIKLL
ncbi:MAG: amidohydrolase family protein [Bacteroidales bacterium]